jgi:hypothetical protein
MNRREISGVTIGLITFWGEDFPGFTPLPLIISLVQDVLVTQEPLDLFHLQLSSQAFDEFREFRQFLTNLHCSPNVADSCSFSWVASFSFSLPGSF